MSYSHILFEAGSDGIAVVTIDRQPKLNALNRAVLEELSDVVNRLKSDESVRGWILTGAGEKAFVAGADIGEIASLAPVQAQRVSARGQRLFRTIELLEKPSVAAINGYALGGGLELAMACTLRMAARGAKLGQPEVKLGIVAGYGGTQRLPRLVGRGRALEILLTGEPIDAEEAYRIGLVNRVVDPAQLLAAARSMLAGILANSPAAVALTLQAVDAGSNMGLEEGMRFEAACFGVSASSDDRAEGTRAFLEKRKPAFTGR